MTGVQTCALPILLKVINDILDFSKIEAGKLSLEAIDFDIRDLIDEISSTFDGATQAKGLALTSRVGAGVPPHLRGDPGRIRQVLSNLIGNAIKFTAHGAVNVDVAVIEGAGTTLRLGVRDTGVGIAPDALDRIFDAFAQADGSTSRKYGGTGLGLTISRQLVQMMGGEIDVVSECGRGSEFWFTVRLESCSTVASEMLAQEPVNAAWPARAGPGLRSEGHVLLAEDNDVNQLVASLMLESFGLDVDIAPDGLAVLAATAQTRYDLVLMDCQMPGMDGFAATAAIRRREARGEHCVIVALTAHAMDGDRERCLAAGMDDYLSKPLDRNELARALSRWIVPSSALQALTLAGDLD